MNRQPEQHRDQPAVEAVQRLEGDLGVHAPSFAPGRTVK